MRFGEIERIINEADTRVTGHGASEIEIVGAERRLCLNIQGSYRRFLSKFGWGGIKHIELYGLGTDVPPFLDLVRVTLSERNEMMPRLKHMLLPIMNDGGGNLYCLDMESRGPNVVFWDHELGTNQTADVIAENFETWLWKLVHND